MHSFPGSRSLPVTRLTPTFLEPNPGTRSLSWSWASVEGQVRKETDARRVKKLFAANSIKVRPGAGNNWTKLDERYELRCRCSENEKVRARINRTAGAGSRFISGGEGLHFESHARVEAMES